MATSVHSALLICLSTYAYVIITASETRCDVLGLEWIRNDDDRSDGKICEDLFEDLHRGGPRFLVVAR
jgi:hypothetical protein